jgi:hypothetical protein
MCKREDLVMNQPAGHTILTGLLAPDIQEEVASVDVDLTDREYRAIVNVLVNTYVLVDAIYLCRAVKETAARTVREPASGLRRRRRQRQTTIEEYIYPQRREEEKQSETADSLGKEETERGRRLGDYEKEQGDERLGTPQARGPQVKARWRRLRRQRQRTGSPSRQEQTTGGGTREREAEEKEVREMRYGPSLGEEQRSRGGNRRRRTVGGHNERRRYKKARAGKSEDGQDEGWRDVSSAVGEAGYERAMVRPHDNRRWDQKARPVSPLRCIYSHMRVRSPGRPCTCVTLRGSQV